jgi:hypothetical protein
MPSLPKISASSFIRAMLRARWVFSMTLAASATRMLLARWPMMASGASGAMMWGLCSSRRRARYRLLTDFSQKTLNQIVGGIQTAGTQSPNNGRRAVDQP